MIRMIIFGIFSILIITSSLSPIYAEFISPAKQLNDGVEPTMIQCNDGKILMMSAAGKPACVTVLSSEKLLDRGFSIVESNIDVSSQDDVVEIGNDFGISNAPGTAPFHNYNITFSKYPKVGETAEITFTGIHKEPFEAVWFVNNDGENEYSESFFVDDNRNQIPVDEYELPPVKMELLIYPELGYRIFDITSNIESGDKNVFLPYSQETDVITTIGEEYTIKAKIKVLEEGAYVIFASGWINDRPKIAFGATESQSKSMIDYHNDGDTFLDSWFVEWEARMYPADVSGAAEPQPEPEPAPITEEEYFAQGLDKIPPEHTFDDFLDDLAFTYKNENFSNEMIMEELTHFEFPIQNMTDFLRDRMNYTEKTIDDLIATLPDDYLEFDDHLESHGFVIPQAYPYSSCDVSYVEPEPGFGFQYKVITPTDYTITGGEFLSICVEPDYLWYTIYLDVKEPGSLTVTIPKDVVDLKQFNYESCYPDDLTTAAAPDGKLYDSDIATVKQISETKDSRVLEFSWSKPISKIDSFGPYAIIDGVDYSEPKSCIGLVESGELKKNEEIKKRIAFENFKKSYENTVDIIPCISDMKFNYDITVGNVLGGCSDNNNLSFIISLGNVSSDSMLTVDIPYEYLRPSDGFSPDDFFVIGNGFELSIDNILITRTDAYQTFNIPLLPHTKEIEITYSFLLGGSSNSSDNLVYDKQELILHTEHISTNENKTQCRSNHISIMKHDYSKSACVTPTTAEKLVQRGWAI